MVKFILIVKNFGATNRSKPTFSHHKLTVFEYADGVNNVKLPVSGTDTGLTDLDMYYAKVSNAFNPASNREIRENFPTSIDGFAKQRPEWEICWCIRRERYKNFQHQIG